METTKVEYDARVAAIHSLRVNIKSLAAEARIIRQETRRAGPAYRNALAEHRRGRLRSEARYAHLAQAFIRGRAHREVEVKTREPAWKTLSYAYLARKIERHWRAKAVPGGARTPDGTCAALCGEVKAWFGAE